MWSVGSYQVARPEGAQLAEARAFCNRQYGQSGYITRDSDLFPPTFLGVYRGTVLHGTIGTYLNEDMGDDQFPTEAVYGFSLSDLGIDPEKVGEVGRFSGDGLMFVAVISFMTQYMFEELNLKHALFGVKPYIDRALNDMGIATCVHSQFLEPIIDQVPEEFRPYFERSPVPIVVTVDLKAAQGAAKACLSHLAAK